ncbi:MAG: LPS export ABC transporter permease LptG [Deltaproteobacteria bacterium]|nr:LPS export ABC transporter permease LptG [Deltaproteobacteria bacterium]
MKIINRYIASEFLKAFGFILLSLGAISFIVDFVTRVNSFLSQNASAEQVLTHFLWQLPFLVSMIIPASSLLAVLVVFTVMSRNNEIIALKAGGVSVAALVKPLMIIALAISLIHAFLNGFLAPYGLKQAQSVTNQVQKRQDMLAFKSDGIWYKDGEAIYNFTFYDAQKVELRGVSVFVFDKDFNITTRLQAPMAYWRDGGWVMRDVTMVSFTGRDFPLLEKRSEHGLTLKEKPQDFVLVQSDTSLMTLTEIQRYAKHLLKAGTQAGMYLTELHGKIAFSLVNLILVIIGAVFSITFGREGGVAGNIGIGIGIGFSYWVVFAIASSAGKSGYIPPVLAAWSANILFGLLALWLLKRVKT